MVQFELVWNDALWVYKNAFKNGKERPKDVDKLVITQAKKTESRAWLSEVSNIVLQQSFRDLQQAWNNYFSSLGGSNKLLQSRTGLDKIPPIFEVKIV